MKPDRLIGMQCRNRLFVSICPPIHMAEVVRILLADDCLRMVPFVWIIYHRAMQTNATQTSVMKSIM